MPSFWGPELFMPSGDVRTPLDRALRIGLDLFVENRFYPLFSFLFGLGFYLFMKRARDKGAPAEALALRRFFWLLGFGAVHLAFFWFGDILHTYALGGLALLLFERLSPRALWRWALGGLVAGALLFGLPALQLLSVEAGDDPRLAEEAAFDLADPETAAAAIDVYRRGDVWSWLRFRWRTELPLVLGSEGLALVQVLPFMLVGLAFGKLGVAERPAAHRALLNRGLRWALVVWLPLFLLLLWRRLGVSAVGPTVEDWALVLLTGWAMSFVYGLVFFRWVPPALPAWTAPIVAVGRMAFTNYILQTVLAVGLMRLFRLYGATTLAEELWAAGAIYGVNVAVSRFWLRRYRFGPLEWLWRMGTYGRWIPLRR
ncbi:DUF418 domain-containing protein [Hydrogenibacillus schlegelii]|uniref:DUF418 domain-containing protein n=2 Tax=Hydrogenibacillus schlegelii TaxID=1484 RepID=A0A179IPA6_HYDSH|nr:DUF418 domain-containing protein [Hydrogenibacillus schlegelii]OAR04508.1 hypothetical protein SA87_10485 [Hydrogenibacillus schlegelii]